MSSVASFMYNLLFLHALFISRIQTTSMRCDLHVHSTGSGMCNTPGLRRLCKESYNDPADVYARCKRLGMSIVTVTDHDSIESAEALRKHPDFFLSEEVTVRLPTGTEMHMGVYCITERDHLEIQRRRHDFISLLMYLTERKLFFSVNHVLSGLTGHREQEDFDWFASYVPTFEVRNGQMWEEANLGAERLAKRLNKIAIAGSDSHTLSGIALTYTEVPGTRTVEEFFAALRAGRGTIHGQHGSYQKLTADIYRFAAACLKEKPWMATILPLTIFVPLVTGAHWFNEIRFCKQWAPQLASEQESPRMLWDLDAGIETNWAR
jgi:predicted metal-dependent phosphoesterase TrpH